MTNAYDEAGLVHEWTIADRLRTTRLKVTKSKTHFAALLGVSVETVHNYEDDDWPTRKHLVLEKWAKVTGYNLGWLKDGVPSVPSDPDGGGSVVGIDSRRNNGSDEESLVSRCTHEPYGEDAFDELEAA